MGSRVAEEAAEGGGEVAVEEHFLRIKWIIERMLFCWFGLSCFEFCGCKAKMIFHQISCACAINV